LFPAWETVFLLPHSGMKPHFEIAFLPQAADFMDQLNDKAREKIFYNIKKSQFVRDEELLKKINEFIWEFRTLHNGIAYRLFAFWDKSSGRETIVIATHGFIKKKQKTPLNEIRKAEEIRIAYLKNREKTK
jgi:phage-related protein